MKPENLELHIGELVLHGFAPGDRYRIGEAVGRELVRLLAERDLPLSLTQKEEIDHVEGEAIEVPEASKAEAIGTHIAQAVYRGLVK